jgi:site-specific recombinase
VTRVHADIDALQGLHEALARFRQVMREVADRGDDRIEVTRALLEGRAGDCRYRLEQCQAELDACRARADEGPADCSRAAAAVAQAAERLERIRGWQLRIDQQVSEFRITGGRFRDLLETGLPRTEQQLRAAIASLQAARGVPVHGS